MKPLFLLFSFIFLILAGCTEIQNATDVIAPPTAKEIYERSFEKNDSLYLLWEDNFEQAKKDDLQILLPYSESGIFSENNLLAYSYNVQLREGERIVVEVDKPIDSTCVFINFFRIENGNKTLLKPIERTEDEVPMLTTEIKDSGWYKIIVHSGIGQRIPYKLKIYTAPTFSFPISGGSNKNILGFWADPREDGSRSHEGVDIFAPRGTPVIAITDGKITDSGNRGIGGKQVWLREHLLGKTIYYAHLDSITTTTGRRVKRGDTIGFVGNTGNAENTEPHLHFGIYKTRSKAVNPLPYIKQTDLQEITWENDLTEAISTRTVSLRKAPILGYKALQTIQKDATIQILGKHDSWYHVATIDGVRGFVEERYLTSLPSN